MRVLLIISAAVDKERERDIAAGRYPRKDYLELQQALDADLLDLHALETRAWTRLLRRALGTAVTQAVLAWTMAVRYDAIFADRETTGFLLAALLKPRRRRPRLSMIGHLLSPLKKQVFWRALGLQSLIDVIIVHSSLQYRIAQRAYGLRADQIALLPYQTDERFWVPRDVPAKKQICSVGLEYRDYDTLIDAVAGLPVDVVIAAASHWSKHKGVGDERPMPANVRVARFDYAELRDLYAESLFVVVPLWDVENQAGITTILEAMAMGKAMVVSHTRGQTDVVRDRRRLNRATPERSAQPDWALELGATGDVAQGHTGIYVQPGDVEELRRAITYLLEHPDDARVMSANGRRFVEQTMSLGSFTQRVASVIIGSGAHD